MIEKNKTWIRLAGNATKVKAGQPHGWRCFFSDTRAGHASDEMPLMHWILEGRVTSKNVIPGFDAKGDANRIVAWIDMYGNAKIENDILRVALLDP